MLCDHCGEQEATIHELVIKAGKPTEKHLCEPCAKAMGLQSASPAVISDLLTKYVVSHTVDASRPEVPEPSPTCPSCGMAFDEFKKSGLLGCARCYTVFEDRLGLLLERAHEGGSHHVGKIPRRALARSRSTGQASDVEALVGTIEERTERVNALRQQIASAVKQEQYERAAALRDELSRLPGVDGLDADCAGPDGGEA